MNPLWSQMARELSPMCRASSHASPIWVKLNTNESPFGPSPLALEAMRAAAADTLRLYPIPRRPKLREALPTHHRVKPEQVLWGTGRRSVALAFVAILKQAEPLLFPGLTYSFYPVWAQFVGLHARPCRWMAKCAFMSRITDASGGIVSPSQRTDRRCSGRRRGDCPSCRRSSDIPVLVDEALYDFGRGAVSTHRPITELVGRPDMSKSRGLAGCASVCARRRGADRALRRREKTASIPTRSTACTSCATASVRDEASFHDTCARIDRGTRSDDAGVGQAWLRRSCLEREFRLRSASHTRRVGLAAALRQRGVLVRHFNKPRGAALLAHPRRHRRRHPTTDCGGRGYPADV